MGSNPTPSADFQHPDSDGTAPPPAGVPRDRDGCARAVTFAERLPPRPRPTYFACKTRQAYDSVWRVVPRPPRRVESGARLQCGLDLIEMFAAMFAATREDRTAGVARIHPVQG